jgi:hypothetical protein
LLLNWLEICGNLYRDRRKQSSSVILHLRGFEVHLRELPQLAQACRKAYAKQHPASLLTQQALFGFLAAFGEQKSVFDVLFLPH